MASTKGPQAFRIKITSSTEPQLQPGASSIESILSLCSATSNTTRTLFSHSGCLSILWTFRSTDISDLTFKDAVGRCQDWLSTSKDKPLLLLLTSEKPMTSSELAKSDSSLVVVISRYERLNEASIESEEETEEFRVARMSSQRATIPGVDTRWENWKIDFAKRRRIIILCCMLLLVSVTFFSWLHFNPAFADVWVRYDTQGSQGPRYQLQFDHHNVSDWSETPLAKRDWFLRIDDQAMIPMELLDDEERRYQQWFQQRYPEMEQIRQQQDYINASFLGDPYAIQVPSDYTFHMAHCVRAVRRYWQARESGRHVYPRDIDYRHMKHCLDSLDKWAFIGGPRMSTNGCDSGPNADQITMIWETKVCW